MAEKLTEQEIQNVRELAERLSAVCEGFGTNVVAYAAMRVCANALVNSYSSKEEFEEGARQVAVELAKTLRVYWNIEHPN